MIKKGIYIFMISMLPIIELKGAIPYGVAMGMSVNIVFIIAVIGNMIPVPFLIIFAKKVLEWMSTSNKIKRFSYKMRVKDKIYDISISEFCKRVIKKADEKAIKIGKYELLGLFLFVAIPIPGTGAWTGSLIAATLRLRIKPSIIAIFLGVISSGLIMSGLSWLWEIIIF